MPRKQEESLWVADPMNDFFRSKGWFVQNITPGTFTTQDLQRVSPMSGLPDAFIAKKGHVPRWVEYKVIRKGTVKFKPSQEEVFPQMIIAGVPLYIVCSAIPLRKNLMEKQRLYNKVVNEEPNGHFMISKMYRQLF